MNIGPDNIPEATSSIHQMITPGKDERTFLEGQNFRLEITAPTAVVRQTLPLTPYKQLDSASVIESESSYKTSETDNSKRKRGMNIDDIVKVEFLTVWIMWSEVPFGYCISGHKTSKAMHSIANILR